MKNLRFILLVATLLITCASLAEAHAFLDHAEPAVGSKEDKSPEVVKLWFTRHLKSASSTVQVFDSQGHEVDQKDIKINPNDRSLMTVSISSLPAGTYKVTWTAVCLDTHTTHGSFTFTIGGS